MKKHNPLVSIIIPTCNRIYFLRKTLRSILMQSYSNLEVIVISDGIDEKLPEFITSFHDNRLKLLEIEHTGIPSIARNHGLAAASGNLIAFCDDDDIFLPTKISKQVKVFVENPDVKLCYTGIELIDENDNKIFPFTSSKVIATFETQLFRNEVPFSTVMVCKSVLPKGLCFDERPLMKASEDYPFIMDIIYKHRIFFISDILAYRRIHKNNFSQCNEGIKFFRYYLRMLTCTFNFLRNRRISLFTFLKVASFHFIHVVKQFLFPYFNNIKRLLGIIK